MTLSSPLFLIQVKVNPGATRGALPYQSPLLNILLLLLRLSFNEQQPGHRQTGYRRHWDTFNLQTLPSPPLHSTRSNCLPGFARLLFFTELDLFLMKRWPRVVERGNCRTCETQPAPVTTVFFFCLWGINQEPVTCLLPLVPLGICIVKRKTKEAAAHWWSADAFFFRGGPLQDRCSYGASVFLLRYLTALECRYQRDTSTCTQQSLSIHLWNF